MSEGARTLSDKGDVGFADAEEALVEWLAEEALRQWETEHSGRLMEEEAA